MYIQRPLTTSPDLGNKTQMLIFIRRSKCRNLLHVPMCRSLYIYIVAHSQSVDSKWAALLISGGSTIRLVAFAQYNLDLSNDSVLIDFKQSNMWRNDQYLVIN